MKMDIYRDRRVFRDEDEENEMFKSSIVPGGRATDVYIHQLLLTREMREPKSNVFDFISTVPEVDFLENLKTVMTRVLYHFPYILANDTPRFILGKHEVFERDFTYLISTLKGTPEEQVIKFLIQRDADILDQEFVQKLTTETIKRFENCTFENWEEVITYLDPLRGQWGITYYYPLLALESLEISKYGDNADFRESIKNLFYAGILSVNDRSKDYYVIPLEEFLQREKGDLLPLIRTTFAAPEDSLFSNLNDFARSPYAEKLANLPLHYSSFRNYISTLSFSEVMILGKNPYNSNVFSEEQIIAFSESICFNSSDAGKIESMQWGSKCFNVLIERVGNQCPPFFWVSLANNLIKRTDCPNTLRFLTEYFANVPLENLNKNIIENTIGLLFGNEISIWLREDPLSDFLMGILLKNFSVTYISSIITEVCSERPLYFHEWQKFISNNEMYKSMPTAWWIPLIEKETSL